MNNMLVALFRAIFGFIAWAQIFVLAVTGGIIIYASGGPGSDQFFIGLAFLVLGPAATVLVYGAIALMIQNNDLLRQIARKRPEEVHRAANAAPHRKEPSLLPASRRHQ